jgi:DegV family protein with EDD domain
VNNVAILADSIACLTPELVKKYKIRVIPINIHFDGRLYRDGVDLTSTEAYRLLDEEPGYFSSSPASIGEYLDAFRAAASGNEGILCITLSSRLSTIYNIVHIAKEKAEKELPHTPIEVVDSMTAATGEGLVVSAAAQAAVGGRGLPEVAEIAKKVGEKVNVIGVMETIRHAYRTGRIPKFTAQLGSVFSIKPIFTITKGVVRFAGLARNKELALRRALNMMKGKVGDKPVHVAVAHAEAMEEGARLKDQISAEFNCVELWLTDFSPVMGYATGTGVLAVAFYTDS